MSGYIALRPPTQLQPGDVLAPHLYDLHFDGVDDYVRVAHSPSLDITSAITFVLMINIPQRATGIKGILSRGTWWGPWLIEINHDYNVFGFRLGISESEHVALGVVYSNLYSTWSHFVLTGVSGGYMRIYLNGAKVAEEAFPYSIGTYGDSVYIGRHAWGNPVNAVIGYLLIYSRALTDVEVSNSVGGVVSADGLRLFIDPTFFDGSKYVDLSGWGNHAYPYNGPLRVPAERPFLWVVRGSGGGLTLRFFPVGSVVVFSDGSAVVVSGPANPVGLVDTFLLGRTDVAYVLVPDPSRPGSADVLTRGDVGVLRFFPYLPTGGLYPYSEVEVVFDKLVLESFSTYPQNGTRLNAIGGSFEVCARLVHAYDGLVVTAGEVYLAGSAASFNGTCWRAVVLSPGYVSRSVYRVVSSAREGVWGVELVDAVPELVYTWDSIAVSPLSVDYASEVVSFGVRYAYDLSPLRSGYVRVVSGSWVREVVVSEGVATVSLRDLPNATSSDLRPCAVYASDGAFVEAGASACADFYVLDLGLFGGVRAKSSRPVAYLWSTDALLALDVRADTYLLFRGSAPALFFLNGVRVAAEEVRGNLLVRCSGSVLVIAFAVARPQTLLGPAPGGGVLAGFAENLTDPLSGLAAYVLVNETSALAVVSYGSVVLAYRELPPTNLPASLVLVYDYDSVTRVFTLYGLVVHGYGLSTRFYAFSVSAVVDHLPDLSAFVCNP
ncbi:MAG: LamG domain-containing protein, partial [Thermofilum sp.]